MRRDVREVFIGSPDQEDKKVGVTAFITTAREGFLYEVHGAVKPLARYPYTASCLQVEFLSNLFLYLF